MQTEEIKLVNPKDWVKNYGNELYGFAFSKLSKQEVAEDLVQDTFLSALNAMDSFKGKSSERTWLYTILKNKIADYYRKASTRYETAASKLAPAENSNQFVDSLFSDSGEWNEKGKPNDWGIDYTQPIEDKEFHSVLENCLGKLPETWNSVVNLKFIEEEDTDKICKDLNISTSNYWVIMHRAKLQLRACIEKNWIKA